MVHSARHDKSAKPAESLGEATDYGIGLPKVRKIVLNCDSFSHPHVHSVTGTGEVCDEEAARRQFLKQALEPGDSRRIETCYQSRQGGPL